MCKNNTHTYKESAREVICEWWGSRGELLAPGSGSWFLQKHWRWHQRYSPSRLLSQGEDVTGIYLQNTRVSRLSFKQTSVHLKHKGNIRISLAPCHRSQSTQVNHNCSPHLEEKWFCLCLMDEGNKPEGKAVFHQCHAVSLSHWPTVCSLVCRGYTENRKTTFFSLVQVIFHSYKNPPEQLKCKTKEYLPSSTGPSSWATRQGPQSQHVEMERIKTHRLPYFPNKTHTLCTWKLQFFTQPPSEGHCGSAPPPAGDHPVLWGIPTWDYPGASSCF